MGKFRYQGGSVAKTPHRGEIWLAVDRDKKHNNHNAQSFDNSVQGGTRIAIIVSNDIINSNSSEVEVVFTTTKNKTDLPTHFNVSSTPQLSIVLCEQVITIPKKNLSKYYGELSADELTQLNRCLKISLELFGKQGVDKPKKQSGAVFPHRNEIWEMNNGDSCIIVSNDTGNYYSPVIEVVYLSNENVKGFAQLTIGTIQTPLKARFDRITTVPKKDMAKCLGKMTLEETARLNQSLMLSLSL